MVTWYPCLVSCKLRAVDVESTDHDLTHSFFSLDRQVRTWTSDVQIAPGRHLQVLSYGTTVHLGQPAFTISVKRALKGISQDHYDFDPLATSIPMIGAAGKAKAGVYGGDCGSGDFDCYHGPRQKLNLPMALTTGGRGGKKASAVTAARLET